MHDAWTRWLIEIFSFSYKTGFVIKLISYPSDVGIFVTIRTANTKQTPRAFDSIVIRPQANSLICWAAFSYIPKFSWFYLQLSTFQEWLSTFYSCPHFFKFRVSALHAYFVVWTCNCINSSGYQTMISLLIQTRFAVKKFLNLHSFKKIFSFFDGGILQCTDVGLSMSPLIDHSLA